MHGDLEQVEDLGLPVTPGNIRRLLQFACGLEASSIHLKVPGRPQVRVGDDLISIGTERLGPGDVDRALRCLQELSGLPDRPRMFSLGLTDIGRFRVHLFQQRGSRALVIHRVRTKIPSLSTLGVPLSYPKALRRTGLVLVSGHRRQALLAALIDARNWRDSGHVVIIERHLEYLHQDQLTAISQLEVGVDITTMAEGLRAADKLDPDWLVLGDTPDVDAAQAALELSESERFLVLISIAAANPEGAVDAMLERLRALGREPARQRLATMLDAVLCLDDAGSARHASPADLASHLGISATSPPEPRAATIG